MSAFTGRIKARGNGKGLVVSVDNPERSWTLDRQQMLRLLDGDVVRCQLLTDKRGRSERVRVQVGETLERPVEKLTGRIRIQGTVGRLHPIHRSISRPVLVDKSNIKGARDGDLVVVKLLPQRGNSLSGKVVQNLKSKATALNGVQSALHEYGIPYDWPETVSEEAKTQPNEVLPKECTDRVDLRDMPLATIDGEDARDFDDAVYAEALPQGGWRLLVAIADVSHYVRLGSALDEEARKRGNSVYFPTEVVPMLPESLSNHICSLMPEVGRLCLVCEMHLDADGKTREKMVYEAVMRSQARLTYSQVQDFLDEKGDASLSRPLQESLKHLAALSEVLEKVRMRRGGLDLDIPEARVVLDKTGEIGGFSFGERHQAHRLIEACMLAANVAVSEVFLRHSLPVLYRVHPAPAPDRIEALRAVLDSLNLKLGGGDQPGPQHFATVLRAAQEHTEKQGIHIMVQRALSEAVYQPENQGHFGLAYQRYLHFTSPIRRYPDLLVHRALRLLIRNHQGDKLFGPETGASRIAKESIYPYTEGQLTGLGQHCSATERRADHATRQVVNWLLCEWLAERVGQEYDARIVSVQDYGFFVRIQEIGGDAMVHVSSLPGGMYQLEGLALRNNEHNYRLGDAVRVCIESVDLERMRVSCLLAGVTPTKRPRRQRSDKPRNDRPRSGRQRSGGGRRGSRSGARR